MRCGTRKWELLMRSDYFVSTLIDSLTMRRVSCQGNPSLKVVFGKSLSRISCCACLFVSSAVRITCPALPVSFPILPVVAPSLPQSRHANTTYKGIDCCSWLLVQATPVAHMCRPFSSRSPDSADSCQIDVQSMSIRRQAHGFP